ncbi:hypothetical protein [uncultured Thiodictyon sp.]|jgi:hypothetical protein|nr:hypothetical protein [uncultured Thiodictyon sp.]
MQSGVRENPGHYDNLDYDTDNDNGTESILYYTCLAYQCTVL